MMETAANLIARAQTCPDPVVQPQMRDCARRIELACRAFAECFSEDGLRELVMLHSRALYLLNHKERSAA